MTTEARSWKLISPDDYLAQENDGTWRHEFVNGAVYAMTCASDQHNLIAGGAEALIASLVAKPRQTFSRDMKVRIANNADIRFYYPDVFVACDPDDRNRLHREKPCLIVEVLSDSTEKDDRHGKSLAYRQIPSLQEYVIVTQDVPQVEIMRRRASWKPEFQFLEDRFTLESVDLAISMRDIYRGIDF